MLTDIDLGGFEFVFATVFGNYIAFIIMGSRILIGVMILPLFMVKTCLNWHLPTLILVSKNISLTNTVNLILKWAVESAHVWDIGQYDEKGP